MQLLILKVAMKDYRERFLQFGNGLTRSTSSRYLQNAPHRTAQPTADKARTASQATWRVIGCGIKDTKHRRDKLRYSLQALLINNRN